MRIASLVCFSILSVAGLQAHASQSEDLQVKCQEKMAANQEGLSQLKQLAQLAGNDKANEKLASLDSGCERLATEAGSAEQGAENSETSAKAAAAQGALKGLSSMLGQ